MTFSTELDLAGRPVLVCGGDAVGLATVLGLLDAGAVVTVVAPQVATTVRDLAQRGLLTWVEAAPESADLTAADLVVAATGSLTGDDAVVARAQAVHRLAVRTATAAATPSSQGKVILVGGGPGDPGLLTVAGLAALRAADVIICDRLAPLAALTEIRPGTQVIDVAKIPRGEFTPQERINDLLVEHAAQGKVVVRFKGGDNFIFGRGGEEWQACAAAGIPVEVIPGVSSAVAAPALAGIPLTHRQLTQGFTVVSGHLAPGDPGSTLDWAAIARANTTLVIMMGVATLGAIADELVRNGLDPATPAATIASAGLPSQQTIRGTVVDIARLTDDAGLQPPAITVIGAVAGFRV